MGCFFFQAEDGIRDLVRSRGLGDVYKRQGILIAALNVKYRDFRYIIPFIVQFGLYVSPVAFSSADIYESIRIPEALKLLYAMNPMVGVIDGFRWCILGGETALYIPGFLLSIGVSFFFLFIGIRYFRRTERGFADVI